MIGTEAIGYIGGLLLALCGLPEAISALVTGETGIGWTMLLMWMWGEILTLMYTAQKSKKVKLYPLLLNYGLNIILIGIIILVKAGLI